MSRVQKIISKTVKTVSYTHLDVYKRQVQRESMKIDLKEWGESIDALKTSLDSVSRTISELVDNNDIKLALDKVRNGRCV